MARRLRSVGGMHHLAYRCKRAHWSFVGLHRDLLAPLLTTPARLDLLQALADLGHTYCAEVARHLGITRQTAHEIIVSLEALGLVVRKRREHRTRIVWLGLTETARTLLDEVFAVFVRSGVALKVAARTLLAPPRDPAKVDAFTRSARQIQRSLQTRGSHRAPDVEPEEADGGAPLAPRLRKVLERAIRILQKRFEWLPMDYVTQDLVADPTGPLEDLPF